MVKLSKPSIHHLLLLLFSIGLLVLVYLVMAPFMVSIAWAGILTYITWPQFLWVRSRLGNQATLSALLMVVCLALILVFPLLWTVMMLQDDVAAVYRTLSSSLSRGTLALPDFILHAPVAGPALQKLVNNWLADSTELKQHLSQGMNQGLKQLLEVLGGIGRNTAKFAFALITAFFFYRDGENLLQQVQLVLRSALGVRVDHYLLSSGNMIRAIVQSWILAAIAQGVIAIMGYWIIGVQSPLFFGIVTAVASVIPFFGTVLVWGPISIGFITSGHYWQALALVTWGILFINPADNLIRPLFVSHTMKISLVFVMFGALGGIAAFGLIGLFLGPVILSIAIAVWQEWYRSLLQGTKS